MIGTMFGGGGRAWALTGADHAVTASRSAAALANRVRTAERVFGDLVPIVIGDPVQAAMCHPAQAATVLTQ
ncbi:MAG: hypothetical protein H7244_13795 [Herminiimonas sp.]|nr:hypothetical protein [Herminiimonas sp.]